MKSPNNHPTFETVKTVIFPPLKLVIPQVVARPTCQRRNSLKCTSAPPARPRGRGQFHRKWFSVFEVLRNRKNFVFWLEKQCAVFFGLVPVWFSINLGEEGDGQWMRKTVGRQLLQPRTCNQPGEGRQSADLLAPNWLYDEVIKFIKQDTWWAYITMNTLISPKPTSNLHDDRRLVAKL